MDVCPDLNRSDPQGPILRAERHALQGMGDGGDNGIIFIIATA